MNWEGVTGLSKVRLEEGNRGEKVRSTVSYVKMSSTDMRPD